ncbi:MAG: hypothetical protein Q8J68_12990 [Methanolobus sp.]|nr:hypothetical protein [Methanolobus sp.]
MATSASIPKTISDLSIKDNRPAKLKVLAKNDQEQNAGIITAGSNYENRTDRDR